MHGRLIGDCQNLEVTDMWDIPAEPCWGLYSLCTCWPMRLCFVVPTAYLVFISYVSPKNIRRIIILSLALEWRQIRSMIYVFSNSCPYPEYRSQESKTMCSDEKNKFDANGCRNFMYDFPLPRLFHLNLPLPITKYASRSKFMQCYIWPIYQVLWE